MREMFSRHVEIPFDATINECWNWVGCKIKQGYGRMRVGGRKGKMMLAHRASHILYKGEIPEGLDVLHSCDNPSCVNPSHLRSGTHSENMIDVFVRNRTPKQKIKVSEIPKIIEAVASGVKQSVLAAKYGVDPSQISCIARKTRRNIYA